MQYVWILYGYCTDALCALHTVQSCTAIPTRSIGRCHHASILSHLPRPHPREYSDDFVRWLNRCTHWTGCSPVSRGSTVPGVPASQNHPRSQFPVPMPCHAISSHLPPTRDSSTDTVVPIWRCRTARGHDLSVFSFIIHVYWKIKRNLSAISRRHSGHHGSHWATRAVLIVRLVLPHLHPTNTRTIATNCNWIRQIWLRILPSRTSGLSDDDVVNIKLSRGTVNR